MPTFNTAGGFVNDYAEYPGYDLASNPAIAPNGSLAFKGFNVGMTPLIARITGTAVQSSFARMRVSCQKSFRRFRLVYPVFYQTTAVPFTDTLFAGNIDGMRIKAGFEYPFNPTNTGIAAGRPVVTFDNGASSRVYTAASHDTSTGYFISDIFDIGQFIPAGAYFAIWTAYEGPNTSADRLSGAALIDARFEQRFCASGITNAPVTTEGGAATDWCTNATSFTLIVGSGTNCMGPAAMLIETDAGTEVVGINGDSISFGTGEGDTEQKSSSDFQGTSNMRKGYISRGIANVFPDAFYVNISRGTDRAQYQGLNDTNSQYRHELLRIAGCHSIISHMGTNDTGNTTSPTAFATSTAYNLADTITANSNIYMCIKAGTSLGSGTGPSGTSQRIENGTAQFCFLSSDLSTASQRAMWSWAYICNYHRRMKLIAGNPRLWQVCITPKSTLTQNGGANPPVDQTASVFLDRMQVLNTRIRGLTMGANEALIDGIIDFSPIVEYGYPTQTGLWKFEGIPNRWSQDGLHPNSAGHDYLSKNFILG